MHGVEVGKSTAPTRSTVPSAFRNWWWPWWSARWPRRFAAVSRTIGPAAICAGPRTGARSVSWVILPAIWPATVRASKCWPNGSDGVSKTNCLRSRHIALSASLFFNFFSIFFQSFFNFFPFFFHFFFIFFLHFPGRCVRKVSSVYLQKQNQIPSIIPLTYWS